MLILNYTSKKELQASVGKPLSFTETSMFGAEYKRDGVVYGSNRPSITGCGGREFFANVTLRDGLIHRVG